MLTHKQLLEEVHKRGAKIPMSTLRRWATERKIQGPTGRAQRARWPKSAVFDALRQARLIELTEQVASLKGMTTPAETIKGLETALGA